MTKNSNFWFSSILVLACRNLLVKMLEKPPHYLSLFELDKKFGPLKFLVSLQTTKFSAVDTWSVILKVDLIKCQDRFLERVSLRKSYPYIECHALVAEFLRTIIAVVFLLLDFNS